MLTKLKGRMCQPMKIFTYSIARYSIPYEWKRAIGDREIVGPGHDCTPTYLDSEDSPFPAVRFQRNTPYIQALREKEKCDWRNLTIEEKKCLYRASFCMTFSEMIAPTGEWKSHLGVVLIFWSIALWIVVYAKLCICNPLPESLTNYELIRENLKLIIQNEMGIIEGICSHWDYENWKWKWEGYVNPYYNGEDDDE